MKTIYIPILASIIFALITFYFADNGKQHYNLTVLCNEQLFNVKVYDETELKEWKILDEAGCLYFDGEYFFETPPSKFTKQASKCSIKNEEFVASFNTGDATRLSVLFLIVAFFIWAGNQIKDDDASSYDFP